MALPGKVRIVDCKWEAVMSHYETLLAEHYNWMCGGFELGAARAREFFVEKRLARSEGKALDLGCGSGFQAVALARLGMTVTAVDTSQRMLQRAEENRGDLPVTLVCADMLDAAAWSGQGPFDLAVCMGDSLAHLPDMDAVRLCVEQMREHLKPAGALVLSFRDQTHELEGLDRIIPLRLEPDRIMTTVLDFSPHTVLVQDVVYTLEQGEWQVAKGSYVKTRLRAHELTDFLNTIGMKQIHFGLNRGVATLVYG